jgi:hypothetical protein
MFSDKFVLSILNRVDLTREQTIEKIKRSLRSVPRVLLSLL